MRKRGTVLICVLIAVAFGLLLSSCGGGGGPAKPGSDMDTYTISLGGGATLSVRSPEKVSFASGIFPDGWSKVDEVMINGSLGAGQAAEITYELTGGFDDAVDRVAFVDGEGNWVPLDSTARAVGTTLSAYTTQLNTVFGAGAFHTLSGSLTYSGTATNDDSHPVYLSAYNMNLDLTYIADPVTTTPHEYSFLLPQGDYLLFAALDENNNLKPDNGETFALYNGAGDLPSADILDLTTDRTVDFDIDDTFSLDNTVAITYPAGDTVNAGFTASGSYTGLLDRITVSIDGVYRNEAVLEETSMTWSFSVSISGLGDGAHTIQVDAYMDDYHMDSGSAPFTVVSGSGPATVQGTLTLPSPAPGAPWYAEVLEKNGSWTMVADASGVCGSGASVQYSISDVPQGTYFIFASVDVDSSGTDTLGDFRGFYGGSGVIPPPTASAVVPGSGTATFDFDLARYEIGTVQGTFTLPSASPGTSFELYIDTDTVPGNDNEAVIAKSQTGSNMFVNYSVTGVPVWTYYVYAIVDVDESTALSTGDYLGFFGGSGANPPSSANAAVTDSGTVTCDFSLDTYIVTGWSVETLDSTTRIGPASVLVLDGGDNPHIVYQENVQNTLPPTTDENLKYAIWNGSTWAFETIDNSSAVGSDVSMALDSNGYPHICYWDWSAYWSGTVALKYARWTGSAWSVETVDSTWGLITYTSLALDSSDNPHIGYYDAVNEDLKYARWTGSGWAIETVDSTGDVGRYISITVDSGDNPHISYYHYSYSYDLKYAYWTGSSWVIATVDSAGVVGAYSSVELDANDYPHISYIEETATGGNLKYAYWTGSAWSIETVDVTGDAGYFTSLELDGGDEPRISYFSYDGSLRYALWTGSAWSIQTIDTTGEVGRPSLALDSGGNPHISYSDGLHGKLRYARFIP